MVDLDIANPVSPNDDGQSQFRVMLEFALYERRITLANPMHRAILMHPRSVQTRKTTRDARSIQQVGKRRAPVSYYGA